MIEISATIFGLLQGALVMMNKRCNWIAYVIQMILMVIFSYQNQLYGDTVNSSVYIAIGIAGWFMWGKDTGQKVTKANMTETWIYLSVIIIGTVLVHAWLVGTDDPTPWDTRPRSRPRASFTSMTTTKAFTSSSNVRTARAPVYPRTARCTVCWRPLLTI